MTNHTWLRRTAWALGGASLAAVLGLSTAPAPKALHHQDAIDPIRITVGVEDAQVEWERDGVFDVEITSELFHHDLADHEADLIASNAVARLDAKDSAFTVGALGVKAPAAQLAMGALPKMARSNALLVERIVATGHIEHGDPEHPFMAHARRYFRVDGGRLHPISSKDFNAIVDPVKVHASPDGHSYRFQPGRIERDPSVRPGVDPGVDQRIEGAKPVRDSRMHGHRPDGVDERSEEDLES